MIGELANICTGKMFLEVARFTARTYTPTNDVPVGAIIVLNYRVITCSCNCVSILVNPSAHSEMLVIDNAVKLMKLRSLAKCNAFVTLSPCLMCIGVMVKVKLGRLFYSAGAKGPITLTSLTKLVSIEHGIISFLLIKDGWLADETKYYKDLQRHFRRLRDMIRLT